MSEGSFMTARAVCSFVLAAMALAGCAHGPAPDQFFSQQDLNHLVTDRTLAVSGKPEGTLIYLAPNGTGWLARDVLPGSGPAPGSMSMIYAWNTDYASRVCYWATPLIGKMPDVAPPSHDCVQVLRAPDQPPGIFIGVTQQADICRVRPLEVYAYNAFPQPVIDQYLTQVRVLYGGHIPVWGRQSQVRGTW
jgi:hypothetical protein